MASDVDHQAHINLPDDALYLKDLESGMFERKGIYITFWAAPGKIDALVAALEACRPAAAKEPGTLVYAFHRVSGELEGVSAYEIYADAAAQQAHLESPATAALMKKLPDLLGAPPERHDIAPLDGAKGIPQ